MAKVDRVVEVDRVARLLQKFKQDFAPVRFVEQQVPSDPPCLPPGSGLVAPGIHGGGEKSVDSCHNKAYQAVAEYLRRRVDSILRMLLPPDSMIPGWLETALNNLIDVITKAFCEDTNMCFGDSLDAEGIHVDAYCDCMLDEIVATLQEMTDEKTNNIIDQASNMAPSSMPASEAIGLAVGTIVMLTGLLLATMASGGTAAPATASAILALATAFPHRRHPELEAKAESWVEEYLAKMPLSGLSVGGTPSGLPLSGLLVANVSVNPYAIGREVFNMHIGEIESWLTDYINSNI